MTPVHSTGEQLQSKRGIHVRLCLPPCHTDAFNHTYKESIAPLRCIVMDEAADELGSKTIAHFRAGALTLVQQGENSIANVALVQACFSTHDIM